MPFYKMLRRHVKPISSLKSRLPKPTLPVPANEKLLAWVGDEIVPRESAKVLLHLSDLIGIIQGFAVICYLLYWFLLLKPFRYLSLTLLSKVVMQFGRDFGFIKGRFLSLRSTWIG